jgi:hypothetical protein
VTLLLLTGGPSTVFEEEAIELALPEQADINGRLPTLRVGLEFGHSQGRKQALFLYLDRNEMPGL